MTISFGKSKGVAIVEWEASPAGDVIADATIALLMHAQSSAASIRLTSKPCRHPRSEVGTNDGGSNDEPTTKKPREDLTESRLRLIRDMLRDQFETVDVVFDKNMATYEIPIDCGLETGSVEEDGTITCTAKVAFDDSSGGNAEISVECADQKVAANVLECLKNMATSIAPLKA